MQLHSKIYPVCGTHSAASCLTTKPNASIQSYFPLVTSHSLLVPPVPIEHASKFSFDNVHIYANFSIDIWEIRVQFGNNIFRFLGFYDGSKLIILTNAFANKSQKTKKDEIELAEQRKKEYYERKK
ncbi:MAG: type II toxin-antitoxin system RelE/ParE family toxin [Ignavibacteriaceae bacterium]